MNGGPELVAGWHPALFLFLTTSIGSQIVERCRAAKAPEPRQLTGRRSCSDARATGSHRDSYTDEGRVVLADTDPVNTSRSPSPAANDCCVGGRVGRAAGRRPGAEVRPGCAGERGLVSVDPVSLETTHVHTL